MWKATLEAKGTFLMLMMQLEAGSSYWRVVSVKGLACMSSPLHLEPGPCCLLRFRPRLGLVVLPGSSC